MNRRDFLRRSAIVATGVIAADQLELLERLTHRRRFFPAANVSPFGRSIAEDLNEYGIEMTRNDKVEFLELIDQHGCLWRATENFHFEAWGMNRVTGVMTRFR